MILFIFLITSEQMSHLGQIMQKNGDFSSKGIRDIENMIIPPLGKEMKFWKKF